MLYPLKFTPIIKDKIWGGDKLEKIYGKFPQGLPNIGESWELSGYAPDVSVVENGHLAGKTLQNLIDTYKEQLLSEQLFKRFGSTFPLLFKLIHAEDDLSIQVHPNDAVARKKHGTFGKTEMWYVLHAEPAAELVIGFKPHCSKAQYNKALEEGKVEDLLQKTAVKSGDVFFIPAGLVHAIGKGIIVAEIQQSSNATYRIYDYNRKDDQGCQRELHTDLALEVIDFGAVKEPKIAYESRLNEVVPLVRCDYFTTHLLEFDRTLTLFHKRNETFTVYMCLEGSFELSAGGTGVKVKKGETVMLPACLTSSTLSPLNKQAKVLKIFIETPKTSPVQGY